MNFKSLISITVLILLTQTTVFAQDVEITDNTFSQVIECNSEANIIHTAVKTWASKTFNDVTEVLKLDDAENHKLIYKCILCTDFYITNYTTRNDITVYTTITVDSKDKRFRVRFEDIEIKVDPWDILSKSIYRSWRCSYDNFIVSHEQTYDKEKYLKAKEEYDNIIAKYENKSDLTKAQSKEITKAKDKLKKYNYGAEQIAIDNIKVSIKNVVSNIIDYINKSAIEDDF